MKLFFLFFLLFSTKQFAADQSPNQPIQIDFEHYFLGKPDGQSPFVALTALTWKYSYQARTSNNGVKVIFKNEDFIDKYRSWVKWERLKNDEMKSRVLHHEQGHVNISFIMVKEADKALSSHTYSKKNYKTEIAKLANSISDFFYKMQKNYDEETQHGSNYKMQARWDEIIRQKMLDASKN